ncbi:M81 family metallopeptidase [Candidatus Thioglobus sp.]|nr:M81 family metallopeptidase [Candidatus Thioglobus sp.]
MALKKIAIGGISTECSSYSPLYQKKDDFQSIQGQELLDLVDFPFNKFDIKPYPLFFNKSVPGGPIDREYFTQIKYQFIEDIHFLGDLDGVLLLMHGAMYVDGIEDPEGEWIASVRKEVGQKCIISVSFDLHGQMTNQIISNIDAFAAFKTAPHIDVKETYQRSSMMLCKALNENYRPYVLWSAIPVLVSGEMSSTFVEPCQSIYESLDLYNQESNILDCNLMIGYVWADTKRATASSIVTCTDEKSGAIICKSIANLYWDNRKKLNYGMKSGDIHSALEFCQDHFSIIADSGDNPTAGGVGDRADILKVILEANSKETLIAGIASKSAYDELKKGNEFTIGGTFGGGGPSLILTADSVYFHNQCAIVKVNKTTIVVTKLRRPFHKLKDFNDLKINLRSFQLLIVKSGYLSPDLENLSVPSFMVLSDGAVNQDLSSISNKQRNKKTYPFQDFYDFTPEASNGKSIVS